MVKHVYAKGNIQDGVVVRRSTFDPRACTTEMTAEIQKNRDDGFVLVEVYPDVFEAISNPHDTGRSCVLSRELTESIRQAMDRGGI